MNADDLKKLGIEDEDLIKKIIVEHGKDIEKHKTAVEAAKTEIDGLKAQLGDANKQIESFKGMDIDGVKKSADEWKAKAEQAEQDAAKQIATLKFDHALDQALTGAKARSPKAVRALLEMENLKLNEVDGSIVGLEDQLKKVREANDFLFESDEDPAPRVVAGAKGQTVTNDAFMAAVRKGADLSDAK